MARFKVCAKDFSVANLCMRALTAHVHGIRHQDRLPKDNQPSISFPKYKNVSTDERNKLKQTTIAASLDKQIATNAEIMCSLEVVMCKYSFNSNTYKSNLFCSMFTDSKIAKQFSYNKTKCSYIVKGV